MEHLYTAVAKATGGRDGRVVSSDNRIDLKVAMPKELGGSGEGTNPEQLFAAGYAACFDSALNMVARTQKIKLESTNVTAHITIGKVEEGGFGLSAELVVEVKGVDKEVAIELIQAAHGVCPYSRATKGNMNVTLKYVG